MVYIDVNTSYLWWFGGCFMIFFTHIYGIVIISDFIWFPGNPTCHGEMISHVDWCLCSVVLVRLRDIFEQRCDSRVSTLVSMWSHAKPIQAYPSQVASLLTKLWLSWQVAYSIGFTCWFLLFWVLFKGLWQKTHALQSTHLSAYNSLPSWLMALHS